MEKEEKEDEWELLSPNTSFLDFGLEDIKDLLSKEIDYKDYFIEQPPYYHLNIISSQRQPDEEIYVQEIKTEDPKQSEPKDDRRDDDDASKLADEPRHEPRGRRPLMNGIGEILSIGAAVVAAMVCGFFLGGGRRQEQLHRTDSMGFHMYEGNKANRFNQVQLAAISFGGCFKDML